MQVVRPTPEQFDEALELLQASDVAAYGDTDWTADELREEWDGLDLERDAWLVRLDGRLAGVAHLLERREGRFIGFTSDETGWSAKASTSSIVETRWTVRF